MSGSVTAWQQRRRAGKPALFLTLALMLAGCAAADAPMPFISTPEPETTATTAPANEPAAARPEGAAQAVAPAHAGAAPSSSASAPASANASGAAVRSAPHSPARQDLPFPSFTTPAVAGGRAVMTDAEKAKMQSDLEALAKGRETKMRQDIEQAQ